MNNIILVVTAVVTVIIALLSYSIAFKVGRLYERRKLEKDIDKFIALTKNMEKVMENATGGLEKLFHDILPPHAGPHIHPPRAGRPVLKGKNIVGWQSGDDHASHH